MKKLYYIAAILALCGAETASALSAATVGQDDGYSGRVMDAIVSKWNPPPQLMGDHKLRVVISVDGDGRVLDCHSQSKSGLEALDVSVCAAANAASPFGSPPYGIASTLYFSFWTGGPSPRLQAPAPATPDTTYAELSTERSREASSRAQAMAEAAARTTGKPLPADLQTAKPASVAASGAQKSTAPAVAPVPLSAPRATSPSAATSSSSPPAQQAAEPQLSHSAKPEQRTADLATRLEKYKSRIAWALRNAMFIPVQTPPGTYHATVQVHLDKSGKILSSSLLDGSGDEWLDKYVMQGIKRAGSVERPPSDLGNTFDLHFTLVRK